MAFRMEKFETHGYLWGVVSILSLAPSEVSLDAWLLPSISPVVYRERLLESAFLSIQGYPIVSAKKTSESQIAGASKAEKVPHHTSTTFYFHLSRLLLFRLKGRGSVFLKEWNRLLCRRFTEGSSCVHFVPWSARESYSNSASWTDHEVDLQKLVLLQSKDRGLPQKQSTTN